MEIQEVDARISLFSQMNAFYGIPNLSQETTAAVHQGARAPEVYSSEAAQLQPPTENANPVELTPPPTEQVDISNQAVDLQQQAQAENETTPADTAPTTQATGETQPEPQVAALTSDRPDAGSETQQTGNNKPAAASTLNAETPATAPLDDNRTTSQQIIGYSDQTDTNLGGNQATQALGAGGNANASQPGALFSALG